MIDLVSSTWVCNGVLYSDCEEAYDGTYPVECCFYGIEAYCIPSGYSCDTGDYCDGNLYFCKSGYKVVCIDSTAYCFDKCVDESTIQWCGDGYYGCWIEGCDGHTGTVPNCVNGVMWCCPKDYPKYNEKYRECWKDWWECKQDSDCPKGYLCKNYVCEPGEVKGKIEINWLDIILSILTGRWLYEAG